MKAFFFSLSHNTYPYQSPRCILINYPSLYSSNLECIDFRSLRHKNSRVTMLIREESYYLVRKTKSLTTFTR